MTIGDDDDFNLDEQIEQDQSKDDQQPDPKELDETKKDGEALLGAKIDKMLGEEGEPEEAVEKPKAKPAAQAKPQGEQQQTQQPATNGRTHTYAADGSVVGPDGKVIAKAGSERRHWERARQQEQRAVAAERSVAELNQRVGQAEQITHWSKQLGMSPEEHMSAVRIFGWYKKEPEQALKWLLTEAQAKGYNMQAILGGEAAQGGVNMDAMRRLVQEQVQPLVERNQQEQAWQQAQQAAGNELQQFYAEFPDAAVHEDVVYNVMEQLPNLSLREAYLRVENWAIRNGLDTTRPLAPQVEAKKAGRTLAQARRPAPNFPRGRGGQMETVTGPKGSYDEFSTNDIIRSAMRENGMEA